MRALIVGLQQPDRPEHLIPPYDEAACVCACPCGTYPYTGEEEMWRMTLLSFESLRGDIGGFFVHNAELEPKGYLRSNAQSYQWGADGADKDVSDEEKEKSWWFTDASEQFLKLITGSGADAFTEEERSQAEAFLESPIPWTGLVVPDLDYDERTVLTYRGCWHDFSASVVEMRDAYRAMPKYAGSVTATAAVEECANLCARYSAQKFKYARALHSAVQSGTECYCADETARNTIGLVDNPLTKVFQCRKKLNPLHHIAYCRNDPKSPDWGSEDDRQGYHCFKAYRDNDNELEGDDVGTLEENPDECSGINCGAISLVLNDAQNEVKDDSEKECVERRTTQWAGCKPPFKGCWAHIIDLRCCYVWQAYAQAQGIDVAAAASLSEHTQREAGHKFGHEGRRPVGGLRPTEVRAATASGLSEHMQKAASHGGSGLKGNCEPPGGQFPSAEEGSTWSQYGAAPCTPTEDQADKIYGFVTDPGNDFYKKIWWTDGGKYSNDLWRPNKEDSHGPSSGSDASSAGCTAQHNSASYLVRDGTEVNPLSQTSPKVGQKLSNAVYERPADMRTARVGEELAAQSLLIKAGRPWVGGLLGMLYRSCYVVSADWIATPQTSRPFVINCFKICYLRNTRYAGVGLTASGRVCYCGSDLGGLTVTSNPLQKCGYVGASEDMDSRYVRPLNYPCVTTCRLAILPFVRGWLAWNKFLTRAALAATSESWQAVASSGLLPFYAGQTASRCADKG